MTEYHSGLQHMPDELNVHPHVNIPSVVRWTVPEAGTYLVQGHFDGNDVRNPTVNVKINHNANALLASSLVGFNTRISFARLVPVAQTIRLICR
jgi:hypothetical protein